jgi:hypothetical protein
MESHPRSVASRTHHGWAIGRWASHGGVSIDPQVGRAEIGAAADVVHVRFRPALALTPEPA